MIKLVVKKQAVTCLGFHETYEAACGGPLESLASVVEYDGIYVSLEYCTVSINHHI